MTNYSRTTLRELKKRYLNILKKCLLANLMAFSMVILSTPATASEDRLVNFGEKTYTQGVTFEDIEHNGYGGAIYNEGTITFGENLTATFTNNSALQGGAIYNKNGAITFGGGATFADNSATSYGGAINNSGGSVVFKDTDNNTETPAVPNITYGITFNGDTLFTGNKAESETGNSYGGAISNSGYMLLSGENTFGGYLQDTEDADGDGDKTEYVLDSEGKKISLGNEAKQGGAIYNSGGKKEGDVIAYGMTLGKSTFMGNTALSQGGAIFNTGYMNFTDEALFDGNKSSATGDSSHGGAIWNYGTNAVLTFNDEAQFKNNTATANAMEKADGTLVSGNSHGGAISNNGFITFDTLATFEENTSSATGGNAYGGAINNYNNASIIFGGLATFDGNKSSATGGHSYGGAINNSSAITFGGLATFDGNSVIATGGNSFGGAINNSGTITFSGLATFDGNKSSATGGYSYGGAIRNDGTNAVLTFNDEVQFKN